MISVPTSNQQNHTQPSVDNHKSSKNYNSQLISNLAAHKQQSTGSLQSSNNKQLLTGSISLQHQQQHHVNAANQSVISPNETVRANVTQHSPRHLNASDAGKEYRTIQVYGVPYEPTGNDLIMSASESQSRPVFSFVQLNQTESSSGAMSEKKEAPALSRHKAHRNKTSIVGQSGASSGGASSPKRSNNKLGNFMKSLADSTNNNKLLLLNYAPLASLSREPQLSQRSKKFLKDIKSKRKSLASSIKPSPSSTPAPFPLSSTTTNPPRPLDLKQSVIDSSEPQHDLTSAQNRHQANVTSNAITANGSLVEPSASYKHENWIDFDTDDREADTNLDAGHSKHSKDASTRANQQQSETTQSPQAHADGSARYESGSIERQSDQLNPDGARDLPAAATNSQQEAPPEETDNRQDGGLVGGDASSASSGRRKVAASRSKQGDARSKSTKTATVATGNSSGSDGKLPAKLRRKIIEQFLKSGGDPQNIIVSDSTITTTSQSKKKTITTVYKIVPTSAAEDKGKANFKRPPWWRPPSVDKLAIAPVGDTKTTNSMMFDDEEDDDEDDGDEGGDEDGHQEEPGGNGDAEQKKKHLAQNWGLKWQQMQDFNSGHKSLDENHHNQGHGSKAPVSARMRAVKPTRKRKRKMKKILVTRIEVPQVVDSLAENLGDQQQQQHSSTVKPQLEAELGEFYTGPHATIFGLNDGNPNKYTAAQRQAILNLDKMVQGNIGDSATHKLLPVDEDINNNNNNLLDGDGQFKSFDKRQPGTKVDSSSEGADDKKTTSIGGLYKMKKSQSKKEQLTSGDEDQSQPAKSSPSSSASDGDETEKAGWRDGASGAFAKQGKRLRASTATRADNTMNGRGGAAGRAKSGRAMVHASDEQSNEMNGDAEKSENAEDASQQSQGGDLANSRLADKVSAGDGEPQQANRDQSGSLAQKESNSEGDNQKIRMGSSDRRKRKQSNDSLEQLKRVVAMKTTTTTTTTSTTTSTTKTPKSSRRRKNGSQSSGSGPKIAHSDEKANDGGDDSKPKRQKDKVRDESAFLAGKHPTRKKTQVNGVRVSKSSPNRPNDDERNSETAGTTASKPAKAPSLMIASSKASDESNHNNGEGQGEEEVEVDLANKPVALQATKSQEPANKAKQTNDKEGGQQQVEFDGGFLPSIAPSERPYAQKATRTNSSATTSNLIQLSELANGLKVLQVGVPKQQQPGALEDLSSGHKVSQVNISLGGLGGDHKGGATTRSAKTHNIMMLIDFGSPYLTPQGPTVASKASQQQQQQHKQQQSPPPDISQFKPPPVSANFMSTNQQWLPIQSPPPPPPSQQQQQRPASSGMQRAENQVGSVRAGQQQQQRQSRQPPPTVNVQIYNTLAGSSSPPSSASSSPFSAGPTVQGTTTSLNQHHNQAPAQQLSGAPLIQQNLGQTLPNQNHFGPADEQQQLSDQTFGLNGGANLAMQHQYRQMLAGAGEPINNYIGFNQTEQHLHQHQNQNQDWSQFNNAGFNAGDSKEDNQQLPMVPFIFEPDKPSSGRAPVLAANGFDQMQPPPNSVMSPSSSILPGESAQTNRLIQRVIDEISRSALANGYQVENGPATNDRDDQRQRQQQQHHKSSAIGPDNSGTLLMPIMQTAGELQASIGGVKGGTQRGATSHSLSSSLSSSSSSSISNIFDNLQLMGQPSIGPGLGHDQVRLDESEDSQSADRQAA